MSPNPAEKPRPQLCKALRKCSHGHLNEIFSSSEEEMGLHLEISEIRVADGSFAQTAEIANDAIE